MGVFTPEDCNRLDFEVLAEGGVALYYQHDVLAEDLAWLALERYEVVQFDEEATESLDAFHFEARLKLAADDGEYEASNEGFREAASRLEVPEPGGVALIFTGIERMVAEDKLATMLLLDALSDLSREFLLFGRRFITLAQTDDPDLKLGAVGAKQITWNPRERAGWTRGL